MKRIIAFSIIAVTLLASCVKEQKVEVLPDFTTDKEIYGLNEPVTLTNITVVKNSVAAITKWEYADKVVYGDAPVGIKFAEEGEFPVTLTVTANDGFVQASCTKKIKVMDTNIRPVADFTWSPETVKAGDIVTFTDRSTDADGTIVAWEWKIGSGSSTEQNPTYEFVEYGSVQVSLTVTDNMYGKNTKTVTFEIEPGKFKLDLDWQKTYDASGNFTRFTSPAISPEGDGIYVTSTGGKLVKFSKTGDKIWEYDYADKHKTVFANGSGGKEIVVVTPSVDEDGTVYFAAGNNQPGGAAAGTVDNGIMALNPDGTLKWYAKGGPNTRFGWHSPLVLKDCIATTQTHAGRDNGGILNDQACGVLNKADGTLRQTLYANSGSNGGICALNDKIFVHAAKGTGGANVGFPSGDNSWSLVNNSSNGGAAALWPGSGYFARSCQPAVTSDGKVLLYAPASDSNPSAGGMLICYDEESIQSTTSVAPQWVWKKEIPGYLSSDITPGNAPTDCGGHGAALSSDGKIYVTTRTSLTALSADGGILWTHTPGGIIECVPAVDNIGCVYYCDSQTGSVVKLNPEGVKLAAIALNASLTSSVTIAPDGRLYVVGLVGGAPTLFALTTDSINGPSTNWSQLSGGPHKRSSVYTK